MCYVDLNKVKKEIAAEADEIHELLGDYSQVSHINREEVNKLVKKLDDQKEDLLNAAVRNIFVTFAGKNFLLSYTNKSEQSCVICRGAKFYVYNLMSPYVDPDEYNFDMVADAMPSSTMAYIKDYEIITDVEAIKYIKEIYTKRADKSRAFLRQLMEMENEKGK